MKRTITSTLLAVALIATASSPALADVDVSLNIIPDGFGGGDWTLVAKTDTPDSAGIVALITRFIDGTIPAAGTVNPDIGHDLNGGTLVVGTFVDPFGPDFVEFVYGQDPNDGLVLGVGLPGGPSDLGPDPLGNPAWDNASEIAFGTIPDTNNIPVELLAAANEVEEVLVGGAIFAATVDKFVVRVLPEPSTAVLAVFAMAGLGWRRRS